MEPRILFWFVFLNLLGRCFRGEGRVWRDREMSENRVHDVKFLKI